MVVGLCDVGGTVKCWLCGAETDLSREHKFKASDLRKEFGTGTMHKFGNEKIKILQGANSKYAKFGYTLCSNCNGSITQGADQAYDEFLKHIESAINCGKKPHDVIKTPPYSNLSNRQTINVFRFFAKRIGCHATEVGMPQKLVCQFRIG